MGFCCFSVVELCCNVVYNLWRVGSQIHCIQEHDNTNIWPLFGWNFSFNFLELTWFCILLLFLSFFFSYYQTWTQNLP